MSKLWRNLPMAGLAAVAASLTLVACGDDGGGDHNVELQIVAGIANPSGVYTVRITTPRTTARKPLHLGVQTNEENWTTFDLNLEEGDLVEIAVEAEGTDMVAQTCTVQGATEEGWARAVVFYFLGDDNYVNCANGFIPAP